MSAHETVESESDRSESDRPERVGRRRSDRIEIRGLRVLGTHGVLPEEQTRAQPFEIDLDLNLSTVAAAASDDLADTVDYSAVVDRVCAVVGGGTSFAAPRSACLHRGRRSAGG